MHFLGYYLHFFSNYRIVCNHFALQQDLYIKHMKRTLNNLTDPVMKVIISLLLCLIAVTPLRSQTFETTISGYYYNPVTPGNSIIVNEEGDYLIAGKSRPIDGLNSLVLSKFGNAGNRLWINNFETGEYVNYQLCLHNTTDGGYLLTATGPYEIRLIKTDELGEREWSKSINSGRYEDKNPVLLPTDSTDFVIFGTKVLGPEDKYVRYIACERVDTGGIIVSEKQIGDFKQLSLQSVIRTSDGGYIITGYIGFPYTDGSMLLVCRTDNKGDKIWAQLFEGIVNVKNSCVRQISNEQFIITGTITSSSSLQDRIFFLWLDKDGNKILFRELPGDLNRAFSVIQTFDDGFAFAGSTASMGNGQEDLLIIKTNILGQTEWISTFGGALTDRGYDIKQTPDSGFIVTGSTESYGSNNTYLLKTNLSGDVSCRLDHKKFFEPVIHSVSTDLNSEDVVLFYEPVYGDSEILLYKETALLGSFLLVNRKPGNPSGLIYDSTAIPSLRSYNYKIHIINECGDTSLPSKTHGTIFLEAYAGGSSRNLFWNRYEGAEVETFEILRGTTEENMTALNWVPGHINNFSDTNPPEGSVYYRIKGILAENSQVESGTGHTSLSNIASLIGVNAYSADLSDNLIIAPNPVSTVSGISFPNSANDEYILSVYELTGRLIYRSPSITDSHFEFNRMGIGAGIYLIELRGPEIYRARIIID